MIIFFNRWFPEKTEIFNALIQIEGIGKTMSKQILDYVGVSNKIQIGNLSSSQLSKIKQVIDKNFYIQQELEAFNNKNIKRLSSIACYRGLRHNLGLPLRGQRTHSNARTCRKQKKILASTVPKKQTKNYVASRKYKKK